MPPRRFERPTRGLGNRCSILLSYGGYRGRTSKESGSIGPAPRGFHSLQTEHPSAISNMVISLDFVKFSPNPLRFPKTPNLKKAFGSIHERKRRSVCIHGHQQLERAKRTGRLIHTIQLVARLRLPAKANAVHIPSADNQVEKSRAGNSAAHDFLESARAVYLAKTLILQPISKARRSNLEPCRI